MTTHQRKIDRPSRIRNRAFWSSVLAPLALTESTSPGNGTVSASMHPRPAAASPGVTKASFRATSRSCTPSEDGQHQAVLTVNHDAQTLPAAAAERFTELLVDAFCATAPAGDSD